MALKRYLCAVLFPALMACAAPTAGFGNVPSAGGTGTSGFDGIPGGQISRDVARPPVLSNSTTDILGARIPGVHGNDTRVVPGNDPVDPPAVDPVCTGPSACRGIVDLSAQTNLAGVALGQGEHSVYSTVTDWRPAGVAGATSASIMSIGATSFEWQDPQVTRTFFDRQAGRPGGDADSPLLIDFDFDGDGGFSWTELTNGYDFARTYAVSDPASGEVYLGFHGIPFAGTLPMPAPGLAASYDGRFLIQDDQGAWHGGVADNLVNLVGSFSFDGRPIHRISLAIPGFDRRNGRPDPTATRGIGAPAFAWDGGSTFVGSVLTLDSGVEGVHYQARMVATIYGFDENAFGPGIGGPDEVAGIFIQGDQTTPDYKYTVLFVAD